MSSMFEINPNFGSSQWLMPSASKFLPAPWETGPAAPLNRPVINVEAAAAAFVSAQQKPYIKNVIFHDPATIVYWSDGTKTVVKCQSGDTFSKETGLAMAIVKRAFNNSPRYNEVFKKWVKENE